MKIQFKNIYILNWVKFKILLYYCFLDFLIEFFDQSFILWYNSLLPVKYRTKPIKYLEMRAKIKS